MVTLVVWFTDFIIEENTICYVLVRLNLYHHAHFVSDVKKSERERKMTAGSDIPLTAITPPTMLI
jgi:hypothetical protein